MATDQKEQTPFKQMAWFLLYLFLATLVSFGIGIIFYKCGTIYITKIFGEGLSSSLAISTLTSLPILLTIALRRDWQRAKDREGNLITQEAAIEGRVQSFLEEQNARESEKTDTEKLQELMDALPKQEKELFQDSVAREMQNDKRSILRVPIGGTEKPIDEIKEATLTIQKEKQNVQRLRTARAKMAQFSINDYASKREEFLDALVREFVWCKEGTELGIKTIKERIEVAKGTIQGAQPRDVQDTINPGIFRMEAMLQKMERILKEQENAKEK